MARLPLAVTLLTLFVACDDGRLDAFVAVRAESEPPEASLSDASATPADASRAGAAGSDGGNAAGAGESSSETISVLLDDFEDGNTESIGGGWWYPQSDGTAPDPSLTIEAIDDRAGSTMALHFSGEGFTDWGMFVGLDLPGGVYDASAYSELRFWAKAEADSSRVLSVQWLDANGFDHFSVSIELTSEWQEYRLPLADFMFTEMDAEPALLLDPSNLSHLQVYSLDDNYYSYWLDDVSFATSP